MSSEFAELHDELRVVARDLLGRGAAGWDALVRAGWTGLEVPVALDGAGATFAEVAVVLEEMGRARASTPFLGSVVLGVAALNLLAPGAGRDDALRRVAGGERVAVALVHDASVVADAAPFRLEPSAGGLRLSGQAAFVPDADGASSLLLLALDPDPVVVHVATGTPGLVITPQPVLDETRGLAHVTTDGCEVGADDVWHFAGDPDAALRHLHDRGALATAIDSLGVSEAMTTATVEYAKVREQFGRPIGSFQAVKHACADMAVQCAVGRALVDAAIAAHTSGDPDATVAVAMAASYVCGAAVEVAGTAMQLHGGIGYTWESGIHAALKRATLNRSLFGAPAAHRRRLATRYA